MLSCSHIDKRFGSVVALDDASLELEDGEVRALIGGNGSGKSTLAKILGGTVRHDRGEILFDGERIMIYSPSSSFQIGIAVTYQELSLLSNLTVSDNLFLNSVPKRWGLKIDRSAMEEKAQQVLSLVGLEHIASESVRRLPLHDRYMVELAKAMIREPRFLVLDEVTSPLHRKQVEQVFEIIRSLSHKGCGILYISHRLHEVFSICNQVSIMRNGTVIANVPLEDISADEIVALMSGTPKKPGPVKFRDKSVEVSKAEEHPENSESGSRQPLLSVHDLVIPGWGTAISLETYPGEILGVGGLQGQGQSELLRVLFGAMASQPGTLRLEGKEVNISKPIDAVRSGLGFLSGDREAEGIFAPRSVKENLIAVPGGFPKSSAGQEPSDTPESMVRKLGIVLGSIRQAVRSLSGGNQQKVVIGRWLGVRPRILVADDPTKGVDVQARHEVHSILRELSRQGSAIIIASSDDNELVEIADRIIVMNEGRIVAELTGAERTIQQVVAASLPTLGNEVSGDD